MDLNWPLSWRDWLITGLTCKATDESENRIRGIFVGSHLGCSRSSLRPTLGQLRHHSVPAVVEERHRQRLCLVWISNKPISVVGYGGGGDGAARTIEHLVTSAVEAGMMPLRTVSIFPQVFEAFNDEQQPKNPWRKSSCGQPSIILVVVRRAGGGSEPTVSFLLRRSESGQRQLRSAKSKRKRFDPARTKCPRLSNSQSSVAPHSLSTTCLLHSECTRRSGSPGISASIAVIRHGEQPRPTGSRSDRSHTPWSGDVRPGCSHPKPRCQATDYGFSWMRSPAAVLRLTVRTRRSRSRHSSGKGYVACRLRRRKK